MLRGFRWLLTLTCVTVFSASAALAVPQNGGAESIRVTAVPVAPAMTALRTSDERSLTELRPVQMAAAPTYGLSNATALMAGSQAVGFQIEGQRADNWSRRANWALAGAAVGAIVGLIDENPLEKALIGGAVGFGLSFVIGR